MESTAYPAAIHLQYLLLNGGLVNLLLHRGLLSESKVKNLGNN